MTTAKAALERECRSFTRLLTGKPPTDYITQKYIDAHGARPDLSAATGFECVLIRHAARGPIMARLADGYARRASPRGSLRKKLVLLLAIVETSPSLHRDVDTTPSRSLLSAMLSLAIAGTTGVVVALVGLACFGALRLVSGGGRHP